jgi:hypothetical protein
VSLDQQNKNFDFTKDLVFQDPFYISTALSRSFPHIYVYYSDSLLSGCRPFCVSRRKKRNTTNIEKLSRRELRDIDDEEGRKND